MSTHRASSTSHARRWVTAAGGDTSAAARAALIIGASVAAVALQVACGHLLDVAGARPDLLLAVTVAMGWLGGWRGGSVSGAVVGWCAWAFLPSDGWWWLPGYALLGAATGIISHPLSRDHPWWYALFVFAAAVLVGGALCLRAAMADDAAITAGTTWSWLLVSSVYATVAALPVFALLQWLWRRS